MLDWTRLAEPAPDGYDTAVTLERAALRGYRRPPATQPAFLDGAVALAHVYAGEAWSPPVPDAEPEVTPIVAGADRLLERVPVLRAQAKRLLHALHPAVLGGRSPPSGNSRSHSLGHRFGTMWATTACPIGLAHAVVHEMAHQKLRALGLAVEDSGTVVTNPRTELFPSPVLPRPRPMSAVLHATYSFSYVLALDLACVDHEDRGVRRVVAHAVERNAARVAQGLGTLRGHARPAAGSGAFLPALFVWIERLLSRT
jgi:HEXXH motif-containing protein